MERQDKKCGLACTPEKVSQTWPTLRSDAGTPNLTQYPLRQEGIPSYLKSFWKQGGLNLAGSYNTPILPVKKSNSKSITLSKTWANKEIVQDLHPVVLQSIHSAHNYSGRIQLVLSLGLKGWIFLHSYCRRIIAAYFWMAGPLNTNNPTAFLVQSCLKDLRILLPCLRKC